MKEEAPLGNPFIGEPRGGWLAHVAIDPLLCPNGVVVELKGYIVEGKGRKEGKGGRPATNLWSTGHA
jgi:hypothetical protein